MAQLVTERPNEALSRDSSGSGTGGREGGYFCRRAFSFFLREGVARVPCHTSCPYALFTCCQKKQAVPWPAP